MLIEDFLRSVGQDLVEYGATFANNGYGDTTTLAQAPSLELASLLVEARVGEQHRRMILGAIGLLQRYEAGGRDSAAVRAPARRTTQVATQAHVSRAHAGDGLTYDVCFDRMELELGLEVIRAGKGKGGKLKLEVKKVVAGSMAGDGEVHVRDELVAYKAAGGAWHKVGFERPTVTFMRDVIQLPRPLELRFRRGGQPHARGGMTTGMLSARSRLQIQSSERARVAAAGFLSRPSDGGVDEQAGCTASGAVLRDRETLGRRAAVLLCDACLTKLLQAEPADTEAARLKQQRQNRRKKKKTGGAGEGPQPIAPATAPTAAAAVAVAAASAAAAAQPATQGKGSKTAASSKRKRAGLRLRTTAGAAAALAKQGLSNMQAEEVRAVERAMAGEAVRWAVFLRDISPAQAAREDATEFRRHRMPGIRRLGPPLTPLPELRTWLHWQLLGLSPTGAVHEEVVHTRAAFTGSYAAENEDGIVEVELELDDELEALEEGQVRGAERQVEERAAERRTK